jgi:hypothetical protein
MNTADRLTTRVATADKAREIAFKGCDDDGHDYLRATVPTPAIEPLLKLAGIDTIMQAHHSRTHGNYISTQYVLPNGSERHWREVAVKLDDLLPGAEEWDNEVCWSQETVSDFALDTAPL